MKRNLLGLDLDRSPLRFACLGFFPTAIRLYTSNLTRSKRRNKLRCGM